MRPMTIVGIVLVVLGAVFMFRGGFSFGTQREMMRIGDMEISAEERQQVPDWLGGVAILGGILLIGVGVQSGRRA